MQKAAPRLPQTRRVAEIELKIKWLHGNLAPDLPGGGVVVIVAVPTSAFGSPRVNVEALAAWQPPVPNLFRPEAVDVGLGSGGGPGQCFHINHL